MISPPNHDSAVAAFTAGLAHASEPIFRNDPVAVTKRDAMWLVFGYVATRATDIFRRALYCLVAMRTLDIIDDSRFDELMGCFDTLPQSPAVASAVLRCFADLSNRCDPQ
jgi:hypothetical protein